MGRAEIVYGESYCVPWSSYKEREQNQKKVPKNQMGMFGCCGGGGASDQELKDREADLDRREKEVKQREDELFEKQKKVNQEKKQLEKEKTRQRTERAARVKCSTGKRNNGKKSRNRTV